MKSGVLKKLIAVGLIAIMLATDVTPVLAQEANNSTVENTEGTASQNTIPSSNETNTENTNTENVNNVPQITNTESTNNVLNTTNTESTNTSVSSNDTSESETASQNTIMTTSLELVEGEVALTIKHYLYDAEAADITAYTAEDMLFTPEKLTVVNGESIAEFVKGNELFSVKSITVDGIDVTEKYIQGQLPIEAYNAEAEVIVCYEKTTGTYVNGTNMIDYVNGRAGDWWSINFDGNYNGSAYNNRIGTKGSELDYQTIKTQQGDNGSLDININSFHRGGTDDLASATMQNFPIVQGLVTGLSGENYQDVNFAYDEPGFFSADIKNGKKTLEGYELLFNRTGASYSLSQVLKNGEVVCSDVSSFYPLNNEPDTDREATGATFFGMRYDFSFSVGDYVSDMVYTFTGDDDVWVCLDGKVILDLGGIHSPYPSATYNGGAVLGYAPNTVDIWEVLLGKGYTVEQKIAYAESNPSTKHTVTVLFMERGGNLSNCYMDFVMPNIEAKNPVISVVEPAELEISKKDADTKNVIAGVEFVLTDADGVSYPARTDVNGYLKFGSLSEGIYTLTETVAAGYHADGPWTVTVAKRVENNGTKIVHYVDSVVKNATQEVLTPENTVYTIENKPVELTQDKNAEVSDWNNRIYKITLETSVDEYEGSTQTAGVTVIDYIDSRFVLTDVNGNILTDGTQIPDVNGNMGIVKKDVNGQYVEWNNVVVTTEGWNAVIYVKARDYFIGGNMIPTNGEGSKVIAGPIVKDFDKPTVNVKLLEISLENDEITLFKGETVTPGTYMDELSETLAVYNINEEEVALAGGIPELNEEDIATLIKDKSITKNYNYLSEEMGTFLYELVDDKDDDKWEDHEAKKVGEKAEDYTLKVTYTAKSLEEREAVMNGYDVPGNNDGDEVTSVETIVSAEEDGEGNYLVNVLAGSILIKKTIDLADADFKGGDPIFTFKVMKDGEFHSYHTVRFSDDSTNVKTVAVKELEKGVYTVEECNTMRYELDGVTAQGVGNCPADASYDDAKATFAIGRSMEEETTVLNKRDGEAGFVNEKNNERNFSDTDVVKNCFVIGEDGTISWTADDLANGGNDSLDESTQVEERPEGEGTTQQTIRGKLQSYNYNTNYINASADAGVRMLENAGCEWRIVQGLAADGSEYVSIESVMYPGYYIRHKNFVMYLEKNDGTDNFKKGATFKMVDGLADANGISFESYDWPGYYLRHSAFVLRMDQIFDDLGRADATFIITN